MLVDLSRGALKRGFIHRGLQLKDEEENRGRKGFHKYNVLV